MKKMAKVAVTTAVRMVKMRRRRKRKLRVKAARCRHGNIGLLSLLCLQSSGIESQTLGHCAVDVQDHTAWVSYGRLLRGGAVKEPYGHLPGLAAQVMTVDVQG